MCKKKKATVGVPFHSKKKKSGNKKLKLKKLHIKSVTLNTVSVRYITRIRTRPRIKIRRINLFRLWKMKGGVKR